MKDALIAQRIGELLAKRSSGSSICPSEVARSMSQDEATWRAWMSQVRLVADAMAREGAIIVTQKGQIVSALEAKGAVRLARPNQPSASRSF